jgi:hypothetical protein
MKSIIAEITDSTNISLAYAYQPIPWSLGCVLGPMIGGALARPADQFPGTILAQIDFLKEYPYFLPCAVPATFTLIAWLVTYMFLKESLARPQPISKVLTFWKKDKAADLARSDDEDIPESERPYPLSKLFIPKVLLAGGNYALLSLVEISFRAIQPLFYSTPTSLGGLGMSPSTIGKILSFYGMSNGIAQVFFFAWLHDRLGSKVTFLMGVANGVGMFASYPLMSVMMANWGMGWWIIAVLAFQTVASVFLSFAYGG